MSHPDGSTVTKHKTSKKLKTPKQYKVLLLNDDYTTMDFVVAVLQTIFNRSPAEAMQIMLTVHKQGRGAAGIYSREVAEAKMHQVHSRARQEGFPLQCIIEEEG